MCSTSGFLPLGRKGGLGMKIEPFFAFSWCAALASWLSEVFSVGANAGGPRELPSETLMGREASGLLPLWLLLSLTSVSSLAHVPSLALHWKPLARRGAAFLFFPGYPSYTPGLQTSWPVIVKGDFSYIMIKTLWSETSRHFFSLEVLRQLRGRDWWGWKYIILTPQKHLCATYLWVLRNQIKKIFRSLFT